MTGEGYFLEASLESNIVIFSNLHEIRKTDSQDESFSNLDEKT
jgi:hypothetical protein